jgi:hypothetical protein
MQKEMENLGKDVLILLAMELNYGDILKFCTSSNKINNIVCKNNHFWRNKLYKDYPSYTFSKNYTLENFREIYEQMMEMDKLLENTTVTRMIGYNTAVFLKPEMINFLTNVDFGNIKGTNIPINFLLAPLLEKGVLSRAIVNILLATYLNKYKLNSRGFNTTPEMNNYLSSYFDEIDKDIKNVNHKFNRNSFGPLVVNSLTNLSVLPGTPNVDSNPLLSKVTKIIRETLK